MNLFQKEGTSQITIHPLQCMFTFHNIKSKIGMLTSSGIQQVKRNSDHQSEGMIWNLHQALQVLVELDILLYQRQLWHLCMPSSRKFIIGIPPQIMYRRQHRQPQQVPHFPRHPHQPTPMGMWELGASHIPPKKLEVFLHIIIWHIIGINITDVK